LSLLPLNSKNIDQHFAEIIDTRSRVDFSDVSIDPLTCDASLLPHIAFSKCANIDNMLENEARLYLSTFNRKLLGTIGSVEDAVESLFDKAKVIEWFNDDSLSIGEFNVEVSAVDGGNLYDMRIFNLCKTLVKKSKNVRSQLKELKLSYLQKRVLNIHSGAVGENNCIAEMLEGYKETLKGLQNISIGAVGETSSYAKMEVL